MNHVELALLFAPQDMMLIFAIGFLLFGPKRLPEIGEALGKTVRAFREGSTKMMDELSRETRETSRSNNNYGAMPVVREPEKAIAAPGQDALPAGPAETAIEVSAEHERLTLEAASESPVERQSLEREAHPHTEVVHGEVIHEDASHVHSHVESHTA
jgi:sec-independent protein translocase protein TatA